MRNPRTMKNPRIVLTALVAFALAGGLAACDRGHSNNDSTTTTNTTTNDTTQTTNDNVSLTGNWIFKQEIMELVHSGLSLQGGVKVNGFVNDPADPVTYPVPVVGSITADGVTVSITEILHHPKHPSRDSRIEKTGTLSADGNTLTLRVLSGQAPQTQVWIRAL